MVEAARWKVGLITLLAAALCGVFALAAAPRAQAIQAGDPLAADFNYVGLDVEAALAGNLRELILTPETLGPDELPLGALELRGQFTDADGSFTVSKDGGLVFPPLALDLDVAVLEGEIGLAEDASGTYDAVTGNMDLSTKIELILGVSDVGALPIPDLGTGPLECSFSPLEIEFSTTNGWPSPGSAFATDGSFTGGAIAGAFRQTPPVTAIVGLQSTCQLVASLLQPVGGIWMANSATSVGPTMPTPLADKPCPAGQTFFQGICRTRCPQGTVGELPNCEPAPVCPAPQTGTPPNCIDPPAPRSILGGVSFANTKATVRRGKTVSLTVRVKNTGNAAGVATVALSSSNKAVKVPKSVKVKAGPGKTGTATVKVKAGKKKGKATISAKLAGRTAKATVTIR